MRPVASAGSVGEQLDGQPPKPTPEALLRLVAEAQPTPSPQPPAGAEWQHAWLRGGEASGLVAVLCCAMWLPQSKLQEARRGATDGMVALAPLLAEAGVHLQVAPHPAPRNPAMNWLTYPFPSSSVVIGCPHLGDGPATGLVRWLQPSRAGRVMAMVAGVHRCTLCIWWPRLLRCIARAVRCSACLVDPLSPFHIGCRLPVIADGK